MWPPNIHDERLYFATDADTCPPKPSEALTKEGRRRMNTTALVDVYDGAVVERYMYDPYGKPTVLHGVRDVDGTDTSEDEWDPRDAADS